MPTTRYVDKDASGANNGTSWADAWETLDAAMNGIAALGAGPHQIWTAGGKTYAEVATIDTAGAAGQNVNFRGCLAGDIATPAIVTVDGEDAHGCLATSLGSGVDAFHSFDRFKCIRSTGDGFAFGNLDYVALRNGYAFDNAERGVNLKRLGYVENFLIRDNVSFGIGAERNVHICGVKIHGCGVAIITGGGSCVSHSLLYANNAGGIVFPETTLQTVYNTTIHGNGTGGNGVYFSLGTVRPGVVINCIIAGFSGAGGRGIKCAATVGRVALSRNNCLYDNDTDYQNWATFDGEILADPKFVNAAGGDFRLRADSPCLGAGFDAAGVVEP